MASLTKKQFKDYKKALERQLQDALDELETRITDGGTEQATAYVTIRLDVRPPTTP